MKIGPAKQQNSEHSGKKIFFRQLRHMTIIFEKKENAWLAHTILDLILRMKTFTCKKSARADFMEYF